jgi:hypothetical protein
VTFDEFLADPQLGGKLMPGPTWSAWRTLGRAIYALPPRDGDREVLAKHAAREWPSVPIREVWIICGRRSGKTVFGSALQCYQVVFPRYESSLGERAYVAHVSPTRQQSGNARGYSSGLFRESSVLASMVTRETLETIELSNRTGLLILAADYRSLRGFSLLGAVVDEAAYLAVEGARPADEVVRGMRPPLLASGGLLAVMSSPYSRQGILFDVYQRCFGKNGDVLVWKAASADMNPTLPAEAIARALEEDPEGGSAEWLGEFRSDVASFVSREAAEACVVVGRYELPPGDGVRHQAFVDAASGSGADRMALGIAHRDPETDLAVLDLVREVRPPFSPAEVTRQFSEDAKRYRCYSVIGDRWAAGWVAEEFQKNGIRYEASARSKSEIYGALLGPLNSGRVALLDNPRLVAQLVGLERKTSRGGRDSIDHGPGGHDDVVNAAAGALVEASRVTAMPGLFTVGGSRRSRSDFIKARDIR